MQGLNLLELLLFLKLIRNLKKIPAFRVFPSLRFKSFLDFIEKPPICRLQWRRGG